MLTILHLSDLHFGPPYVPRAGEALLEIAPTLRPDVIVVSGDLTQRAKRRQFAAARAFLDQLPQVPKVVVPGNHDVPLYRVLERATRPYALYQQYISPKLDQVLRLGDAVIVGLNSTAPWRAITNGRIRVDQLDLCSRTFANVAPETARIIVVHHHFAPAPDYLHDQTMPKAKRAIERFVELDVELILGGHLHRAYIGNSLDFYPGNQPDRGIIIVQSGTTTSRRGRGREREKNSFNLIEVDTTEICVTHYILFESKGSFVPLSQHYFARSGCGLVASGRTGTSSQTRTS